MSTYIAKVQTGPDIETVFLTADSEASAREQAARYGNVLSIKRRIQIGNRLRLTRSDRAILLQRLAAMIGSKMGQAESLRLLNETFSGQIGVISGELRNRIEAGRTLLEAMEGVGSAAFPEATVAVIRSGSQGGSMAKALQDAVNFEHEINAIRSESSIGILVAAFGFFAGVAALLITTLYIVPEMEASPMIQEFGGGERLAWVTWTSNIMTWLAIVVVVFSGMSMFITKVVRLFKPAEIDRLIMFVPYVRDISLARRNHVAFYGLSVLMSAGLNAEEALRIAHDGSARGQTREDFAAGLEAVRAGRPWATEMQSLHPTDRAALSVSQNRKQVAESLTFIAEQYKRIYKIRIDQVVPTAQLLAAVFLVAAGVVVFGAVMIPMLEMVQAALAM